MCSYQTIQKWQTRLVLVKPNADNSACLELSLVVVDLVDLDTGAVVNHDTIVTYDALSYAWGTASPSIECTCNGNKILLRENLDSALKHLRRSREERYIWIDFLCINQDDLAEKANQIPRMKNIYSKASTVVIWLGESPEIENLTRLCGKTCGPHLDFLDCPIHKQQLSRLIMDYTWFNRTWVRQEVFAAGRLNVSSPYFSTTWELFIKKLLTKELKSSPSSVGAVDNLISLNELYSSRRLELLALLRQGKGFQASVPHDHIFSVLGMMSTPKHSTKATIPVSYKMPYHEICGDVTRYIIRERRSVSVLQLCITQRDRSYAMDWPNVEWLQGISHLMQPKDSWAATSESMEQFEIENPIGKPSASCSSESTLSWSISSPPAPRRPLVLYGRAWGTVTGHREQLQAFMDPRPAYLVDQGILINQETFGIQHAGDYSQPLHISTTGMGASSEQTSVAYEYSVSHATDKDPDEYANFYIYRFGLIRSNIQGVATQYEARVYWEFCGCVDKGDIFVALEPGPCNVLLRRCSGPDDLLEIVGWGGAMKKAECLSRPQFNLAGAYPESGDKSRYYLGMEKTYTNSWRTFDESHAPGPKQQFKIR